MLSDTSNVIYLQARAITACKQSLLARVPFRVGMLHGGACADVVHD
jgi:hypothetical protein